MIEREQNAGVLTLRLAHGKASAMDVELCEALIRELREAEESEARAVILTGSGSIFSAGDFLYTRAEVVARELAAIDPRNFAITKKQLRGDTPPDSDVIKMWSAPEVHDHIREYLGRTVGRTGASGAQRGAGSAAARRRRA